MRQRQAYSEAQVAPALLAALPALMPVLQQVLNPQTIQTVLDAPNRATQTVLNGIKDFARLGIESHEQDLRHLREIHPSLDDPALDQLLASLSVGFSQMQTEPRFKRVPAVALQFVDVEVQQVAGRSKVPYRFGQALAFPLVVKTPRTIPNGELHLVVKDAESLEIAVHRRFPAGEVGAGRIGTVPRLDESHVRSLQPGRDYLVTAFLTWQNRAGEERGSSIQQRISLVGDAVFDRVEESGELLPADDVDRHRSLWHKIWQASATEEKRRFEITCKYYYVLGPQRTSNARMETVTKLEHDTDRNRVTGKLKTGMELSVDELNELIPLLQPGPPALAEADLQALRSEDFAERFNQAARYRAAIRGRPGDLVAIWVYPELKMQQVVIAGVGEVDANGHVRSMVERRVPFPMPALVHFVGARSA